MQASKLEAASSLEDEFESSDEKSSGDVELGVRSGTSNLRRVDSIGKTISRKRTHLRPIKSMTEIAGAEDVEVVSHGITPGLTITMKVRLTLYLLNLLLLIWLHSQCTSQWLVQEVNI